MIIERKQYLNELISKKDNGLIKIITGIRRCGKSFLLNDLFYNYLKEKKIKEKNIIRFAFDVDEDIDLLDKYFPDEPTKIYENKKKSYKVNSKKFRVFIKEKTNKNERYYLLLDEIQILEDFATTLNGFLKNEKLDVYVTGSNSHLLSSDIITEFRGRGDQIRIYPLSFKEYFDCQDKTFNEAYKEYQYYGGMPYLLNLHDDKQKKDYLTNIFKEVYIKDIVDRHSIVDLDNFEKLINELSSSIGSYTNPTNLEHYFNSELKIGYSHNTIKNHIEYLKESFLLNESMRFDIKGKEYITANSKYYFTDIGLRNARLNFRQNEPTHIMENIIYNELLIAGYKVDVGIVDVVEKNKNNNSVVKKLEVDFVVRDFDKNYYIQSAYSLADENKFKQEIRPYNYIKDNFVKIVIVNDNIKSYTTDTGIKIVSLEEFLTSGKNIGEI